MIFKNHSKYGLFIIKFHLLDHLCEELTKSCNIWFWMQALMNTSTVFRRDRTGNRQRDSNHIEWDFRVLESRSKKSKGSQRSINFCKPSAANASRFPSQDVIGSVLSNDEYHTGLEELLILVALPADSYTTKDNLFLKTQRRFLSTHAVYALCTWRPGEKAL